MYNHVLPWWRAVVSHISWTRDAAILNYANGTSYYSHTLHRFDPRFYVPPDEIPCVRHSLIPRIKLAWTPLSGENEKRFANVASITRVRPRKTAGTERNVKIIIMHFYVSKYHGNNRRNVWNNIQLLMSSLQNEYETFLTNVSR